MSQATFRAALTELAAALTGRPLDADLDAWLNLHHGAGSATFARLADEIRAGVAEGWLCHREGGGIRYGRRDEEGILALVPAVGGVEGDDGAAAGGLHRA